MLSRLNYGRIFGRAVQIVYRHRLLWLFGVLGGLGAQANRILIMPLSSIVDGNLPPEFTRFVDDNQGLALPIIGASLLAFFLGGALYYAVSGFGLAGLTSGVAQLETTDSLAVQPALQFARKKVIPLLLQTMVWLVPTLLFFGVIAALVFMSMGLLGLCLIPLVCLTIPFFVVLTFWAALAQFSLMLEDASVLGSYRRGWGLLREFWLPVVIVYIVVSVAAYLYQSAITLPLSFVTLPDPAIVLELLRGYQPDNWLTYIPSLLLGAAYLPVLILLQGIFATWMTSVWTLTFLELTRQPAERATESAT